MSKKVKNNGGTSQLIHFNLYLDSSSKKTFIRLYDAMLENHDLTYDLVYKELKENPEASYEKFQDEAKDKISGNYMHEDADPGDYYDEVLEYVIARQQEHSLMHYQFELMSLSNLYQVFEQQVRRWLFKEMTHNQFENFNQIELVGKDDEDQYGRFYSNIGKIREIIEGLNLTFSMPIFSDNTTQTYDWFGNAEENHTEVPIVDTEIWKTILECNLISNTFKHGSGHSAKELYKLHPEYFEKVQDTKLMHLYRTTNMEEVLSVEKISFEKYATAMKTFWEKMKMHQSGSMLMTVTPMKPDEN